MRLRKGKLYKNYILKFITYLSVILFFVFGSMLDSATIIPLIVCAICLVWLVIMTVANIEKISWQSKINMAI